MYHYKAFISYKHDPVDSGVAAEIQTIAQIGYERKHRMEGYV